jgi:hypothetical protein
MLRSTSNIHRPAEWAIALRREMQTVIGRQLRAEWKLPRELPPELRTVLADRDENHDPYADIVGTC